MTSKNYKTKSWDKRNCVIDTAGEVVVRPNLHKIATLASYSDDFTHGAFSVVNGRTNDVHHYICFDSSTNNDVAGTVTTVLKLNQFMVEEQNFSVKTRSSVGDVSYGIVEDFMVIGFPGAPCIGGIVGGELKSLTLDTPVNPNTSSLEVFPQGNVIGWAGRIAVCDGSALYFSDALKPRAFTGANFINPPGEYIYDMHLNAGGSLIICTATGVFSLPEAASFSGQGGIVMPMWEKLSDYSTLGYRKTASYKGRVFGLTTKGFVQVDTKDSKEVSVSEKIGTRGVHGRIHYPDYRQGQMRAWSRGILINMGREVLMVDLEADFMSWWISEDTDFSSKFLDCRGVLRDSDNSDIFIMRSDPVVLNGNNGQETSVNATIAGRLPSRPEDSPLVRHVTFMADYPTAQMYVAVNDRKQDVTFPAVYPVIGTNGWTESTVFGEIGLKSRQLDFNKRGDELFIEVSVKDNPTRIPEEIDVEFKGVGKKRPSQ